MGFSKISLGSSEPNDLGISNLMKISLLKLNDIDFRSKESTKKSLV